MSDKCPLIDNCKVQVRKDYLEQFCLGKPVGMAYMQCLIFRDTLPKKTPSEWLKE